VTLLPPLSAGGSQVKDTVSAVNDLTLNSCGGPGLSGREVQMWIKSKELCGCLSLVEVMIWSGWEYFYSSWTGRQSVTGSSPASPGTHSHLVAGWSEESGVNGFSQAPKRTALAGILIHDLPIMSPTTYH
jgi:hypothetical protein